MKHFKIKHPQVINKSVLSNIEMSALRKNLTLYLLMGSEASTDRKVGIKHLVCMSCHEARQLLNRRSTHCQI